MPNQKVYKELTDVLNNLRNSIDKELSELRRTKNIAMLNVQVKNLMDNTAIYGREWHIRIEYVKPKKLEEKVSYVA